MALVEPLPRQAVLFHIGPPKTGTTALQQAAAGMRPELLARGVRYPGRGVNHRQAVASFMGRPASWAVADGSRARQPSPRHWKQLLGEMAAERERRCWFGHEWAARATTDQARSLDQQLGPSLHTVITLRSFAHMLPSIWQEHLKAGGGKGTFENWLRAILRPSDDAERAKAALYDHIALVNRWVEVLGPDRVRVVVVDRHRPDFVFHAFEGLLDLPEGFLAAGRTVEGRNRSLTAPEAELFRRLNRVSRRNGLPWTSHSRLVVHGSIARVLAEPVDAPPVRVPAWAASIANERAAEIAEHLDASPVPVVGDLGTLADGIRQPAGSLDHREVAAVPLDSAVEALAGMLSAASGYRHDFRSTPDQVVDQLAAHVADGLRAVREVGPVALGKAVTRRGLRVFRDGRYLLRGSWIVREASGRTGRSAA